MTHKGIFIAIEGGEGAGKSTQIELLKKALPKTFSLYNFVFTREPGGTPYADEIYTLFKRGMTETNARTLFSLALASRFDHLEKVIHPALDARKIVVTDRYEAATFAYQVIAQQQPELAPLYHAHRRLIPIPDLTIIISVPVDVALARIARRKGEAPSAFDLANREFHERLASGYQQYADLLDDPKKIVLQRRTKFLDGDRLANEVHSEIIKTIKDKFFS